MATDVAVHELGCNEMHFHASPKCCADDCGACLADKIETPFEPKRPNQLLIELLKQASAIESLVIIARDGNGRLYISWSDQDESALSEAAHLLSSTVDAALYESHAAGREDDDKPHLKLSFLANGDPEPKK